MLAVIPLDRTPAREEFRRAHDVRHRYVRRARRAAFAAGALHQFIPLDAPRFVGRFLDHWRPDLALFVESDLWPNLIVDCADREIPMILVNGRVSERSFKRWRFLPRAIAALLGRFDLCLAQSNADAQRYGALGAPRISSIGNLKLDVPAPPADPPTLSRLTGIVLTRSVIAAASTHASEENEIIAAHRRLRGHISDAIDDHRAAPSRTRTGNRRGGKRTPAFPWRCVRAVIGRNPTSMSSSPTRSANSA